MVQILKSLQCFFILQNIIHDSMDNTPFANASRRILYFIEANATNVNIIMQI